MLTLANLSFEEQRQVDTLLASLDPGIQPAVHSLFTGLNREQVAALAHPLSAGKPLLIIAGAGSGKTSVLTRRVALLLLSGIPPDLIFVSTFTVKAAGEMKERIGHQLEKLAQESHGPLKANLDLLLASFTNAWIGTFHSLCLRMLREKGPEGVSPIEELGFPPAVQILSDAESRRMLAEITAGAAVKADVREIAAAMDLAANDLLTPETLAAKKTCGSLPADLVAETWRQYADKKRAAGMVDFTDLLYLAATAFADRRPSAQRWKTRFTHVLIDEYQDTNIAQYAIATELAAAHRNLFVVGDDDQSIYRFRGADVRNIRAFTADYSDARVVRLIRNYRSSPIILGAANALLASRPTSEIDKTLLASAPASDKLPDKITVYEAADDADEINFVIFQIRELLKEGFRLSDIVIFYRVHEFSETVTSHFRAQNVPFAEVGGKSLLDHPLVHSMRALILAVNAVAAKYAGRFDILRDGLVLREALRDVWSIGKLGPKNREDRAMFESLPAPERILLEEQGYVEAVHACRSGDSQQHLERLWSAIHGAAQGLASATPRQVTHFLVDTLDIRTLANEDAGVRKGLVVFEKFLSSRLPFAPAGREGFDLLLSAFESGQKGEPSADLVADDAVRLMTIHASKGLEFPVVFVIGVEETILPFVHMQASRESDAERRESEEEELRLFYVAITRAKHRLYLTSAARRAWYGRQVTHVPSRFLSKLPKELTTRGSALSTADRAAHRTKQFFKDMFGG